MANEWQFFIDRGGTFTDLVARDPEGRLHVHKLLSNDDSAIAGIRQVLARQPGKIGHVRIGTTVATNALLQRRGARTLLVVNRGLADLLRIGNQARPRLFDLHIVLPDMLYERVAELAGRVSAEGAEIEKLDEPAAIALFEAAVASGIEACAIALIHAWTHPAHEQRLAVLARRAGFGQVSASHEVSPLPRLVPRAETTLADAYLSPVLRRYVDQLSSRLPGTRLSFMQSSGGLVDAAAFRGKDSVLSGPAGGIVGAARTAAMGGFDRIISFDMGGTSTDVALYDGAFERSFETEIAGVRLRAPMMAINTVAAGGGSVLRFDGARLRVGPDSAGAAPGPACYRRGGPLTVTDANLLLGRLQAAHFPAIFGAQGDQRLDTEIVRDGFARLSRAIADATARPCPAEQAAEGFLRIAVANMANAIRQISLQKGHDPRDFTLQCFGGAGGQHACLVADELGMDTVFIHPLAGVLSAYGIGLADQAVLRGQAVEVPFVPAAMPALLVLADTLAAQAHDALTECEAGGVISIHRRLQLRLAGREAMLEVTLDSHAASLAAFTAAHRRRFGFVPPDRAVIVEAVSVEAVCAGAPIVEPVLPARGDIPLVPMDRVTMWSDGAALDTAVFDRSALLAGDRIAGPALLREAGATTVVDRGWTAEVTGRNHMVLRRTVARARFVANAPDRADPVLLELFNNLFMSIAEQMGVVLRNVAQSVNIKERLDFSCAIFDAQGRLVANAPHVPVHLGAMGESVRTVLRLRGDDLRPGDVIALNDPFNGGTHLPDVTIITPAFAPDGSGIRFFVANRGHHADIGGSTPGSTPPDSRTLAEEGVVIDDFLLVRAGEFREAALRAVLGSGPYPARNPDMNVADAHAQVAANQTGVAALYDAVERFGWATVSAYMGHVMDNAAESVRRVIDRLEDGAYDHVMDDGGKLCVRVSVDRTARSATIDFTGSRAQRADNFNAPPAVTRAVVLYVFRCLVGEDIPLNEGCLVPLRIVIPPGTLLSPAPGAAVVAGNTEVSQAVCNALFGALGAVACSQGTMNNFLFGDSHRQYYETICGGAGAGPGFAGASAVQTHMTNTRITDPEILEMRYPVRLQQFALREGSGGAGAFPGGSGVARDVRFLQPMTAVLVSSCRTAAPFGLAGGGDGAPGRQWIERASGEIEELPGIARAEMMPGDLFCIRTPGGGGYQGKQSFFEKKDQKTFDY